MDTAFFRMQSGAQEILKQLNEDRTGDQFFCDFTIKTNSGEFPVHKCLLGASSDYFKRLFTSHMMESYNNSVELFSIDTATVDMVIEFIYDQNLSFSIENIYDLLPAAEYLHIPMLKSRCAQILIDNISEEIVWESWKTAELYNLTELTEVCKRYLFFHFSLILKKKTYLPFDAVLFKTFIEQKTQAVEEEKVFKCVIAWIAYDDANRKIHFTELFEKIDVSRMGPSMQVPRSDFAAVFLNNQIYAIGGMCTNFYYTSCVERLVDGRWQKVASLNIERAGHRAVVSEGKVIVTGGYNLLGKLESAEVYDPRANEWHCNCMDYLRDRFLIIALLPVVFLIVYTFLKFMM